MDPRILQSNLANKADLDRLLDPTEKKALAKRLALAEGLYRKGQSPEEMRADYVKERAYWNEEAPAVPIRQSRWVQTRSGPVQVHIFRMKEEPGPAILYMHGGSYIVGSTQTHECILTRLTRYSGATVLSIDYHLAPAVRFPVPLDECQAVILDIRDHPEDWGVDPQKLALAGDSCGASLAAALFLRLRDQGLLDQKLPDHGSQDSGSSDQKLRNQGLLDHLHISSLLLAYGAYGLRDSMSRRLYGTEADGMTLVDFLEAEQLYYHDPMDLFDRDTNILGNDLSRGFPPTYLCAGSLDPLLDDSKTLAAMLAGYDLPYQLDIYPGLLHCFWQHARLLPQAEESMKKAAAFFVAANQREQ